MPIESPFSRDESNALLAIELANGGELAMLGEIIEKYRQLTHESPDPEQFSESLGLLVDARLVEFVSYRVGLTPHGRKFLRKAGLAFDISRPGKITALLRRIPQTDLGDGTDPAPGEDDIRAALLDRSYMGNVGEGGDYDESDEDEENDEAGEYEDASVGESSSARGRFGFSGTDNDEIPDAKDEVDESLEDEADQDGQAGQRQGRFGSLFRRR